MSSIATKPMTIAEFDKLDLPADKKWELHNGELVEMSFPAVIHKCLQQCLQQRTSDLLRQAFPDAHVLEEYPYQIEETNDKQSADVGMTTKERGRAALQRGVLVGAPELVVEVLSPSNTVEELKRLRRLCFAHGTLIFLTLDPDDSSVEMHSTASKPDCVLGVGDTLLLTLFGDHKERSRSRRSFEGLRWGKINPASCPADQRSARSVRPVFRAVLRQPKRGLS